MEVLVWLLQLVCCVVATSRLQLHYEWNALDYEFPNENEKFRALLSKKFIPENNLPVGIEIWRDKLFVTVPRWRPGIPSTLNYVPLVSSEKSPKLIPYPSLDGNELGNCDSGLSTVYRISVDKCDRLWVLDTGTFGIGNTTQNLCPYTINIFDLNTDRLVRKYQLRTQDINPRTFIANLLLDQGKSCEDTFAYLSDELGYGLIVYSFKENTSWRFEHSYFMPDPLKGDFNIAGLNFQWGEEGIFGMSLSPMQPNGQKIVYFSPLASNREFVVSNAILQNKSKVEDSYHDFYPLNERGPNTHTTARVMNKDGIQFFNLIDQNAVGCWNYLNNYEPNNLGIIDMDDTELIFPSDVKVDRVENLWVMSDRMSTFLVSNLNFSEVNFRVFFAPISVLVKNTVCDVYNNDVYYKNILSGKNTLGSQSITGWEGGRLGGVNDYGYVLPASQYQYL